MKTLRLASWRMRDYVEQAQAIPTEAPLSHQPYNQLLDIGVRPSRSNQSQPSGLDSNSPAAMHHHKK